MALEVRFHKKNIHEKYLSQNNIINEIFNAFEKSRIEAKGSEIFKGIKFNILDKHKSDLRINKLRENDIEEIVHAMRYVS